MNFERRKALLTAILLSSFAAACSSPGPTAGARSSNGYGPLTFNRPGADFYFAQDGQFAHAEIADDGAVEIHLRSAPFQIGYNGRLANLALAQVPISEIATDPKGFKASRLSGPMAGGREPNSDLLLVYTGRGWSDGNTEFSDDTSMKAEPMSGFQHAYYINKILFVDDQPKTLEATKGPLFGYIVVYKRPERSNRDIMPIRLIFDRSNVR